MKKIDLMKHWTATNLVKAASFLGHKQSENKVTIHTCLEILPIRGGRECWDEVEYVHDRCITTAFVNDIVDVLQGIGSTTNFVLYKWHGSGKSTEAEAAADTGLTTPTTGENRAAGTQTTGTGTNRYVSVGTITYTATATVTEHGFFNDSATGICMDRTVFAGKAMAVGEAIQFTYTVEFPAGS